MRTFNICLAVITFFFLFQAQTIPAGELESTEGWRQGPGELQQFDGNGSLLDRGAESGAASLMLSAKTQSCSLNDCPWDYSLEVELRPAVESFTGNPTHSSSVMSRTNQTCQEVAYGPVNVAGLTHGTAYKWQAREKVIVYDASYESGELACTKPTTFFSPWEAHGNSLSPSFIIAALVIRVIKDPVSVVKMEGSSKNGLANRLNVDDDRYYRVWATAQAPYVASWYALFNGIEKGARNLTIDYKGYNSQPCFQSLHIWDWTLQEWIELDSQEVGHEETLVNDLIPPGDLSNYISRSGRGELRVRVRCSSDLLSFSSNGNTLKISYDKPLSRP